MSRKLKRLLLGEFSWQRMLKSLLFIYGFLCFYGFFLTDRMIFLPQPASYQDTEEILKLTTSDGEQISAVYLPNASASSTILYAHGNAEDLGEIRSTLQGLHHLGFAVFAYDYRGYGTSQGKPSEAKAYRDIDAAYQYLTQNLGILPHRIIAYGRSVGGGSAIDLASRQPLGGLIVESSFVTAFRVVTGVPILPFDKFTNLDKIQRVNSPVLVIHGTADEVIPVWHGKRLFAAAKEPKQALWVAGAGHNNLRWVAGDRYLEALREFAPLRSSP